MVAFTVFVVGPEAAGARLDTFLSSRESSITRSQLKRRIEIGEVSVNGVVESKPARKLRAGDEIAFAPAPAAKTELLAEAIPLVVLYEDSHLIAIDKPAGLVVHPAAGHASGTLVNALLHHCQDLAGIGGELRPGIVHRLDRDTTGVLVVAKDEPTMSALGAMFKNKKPLRLYRAIVSPAPRTDAGSIRTLYGRHPVDRKRFSSKVREGKQAVTHWRVLERFGDAAALVECRLETGRTHQIRVHMADSGHGVVGDRVYGPRARDELVREVGEQLGRQALHAMTLEFVHPATGVVVSLAAPLPPDMQAALEALRALVVRAR